MKNFFVRAITGILFVAVLVGAILYAPLSFSLLFTLIAALTVHEFATLANGYAGVTINRTISALAGAYLVNVSHLVVIAFKFSLYSFNIGLAVFTKLYLIIAELYLKRENPLGNWAFTALSQLYVALPFALLNVLAFHQDGDGQISYNPILPLSVFVFIWLSDTGAYMVGSLIGKNRLFERISPKKSWEGSIGGALLSIGSSLVFAHLFPIMAMWQWAGLALVVVVFGTWGDLCESLMKRQIGIKDSGSILPGHGGWLDRFDSALMAIPAAVAYLYFIATF